MQEIFNICFYEISSDSSLPLVLFPLNIVAARRGQMHEDWGSDARALVG